MYKSCISKNNFVYTINTCMYINIQYRKPNNMTERARIPVYPPHKPACHNLSIPEMHRNTGHTCRANLHDNNLFTVCRSAFYFHRVHARYRVLCVYIGRSSYDIVNSVFDIWKIPEHYGVNDLHT